MGNNGLDIAEDQFLALKTKEQNLILFKNIVHVRKQFKDYTFHKKVQYVWLFVLSAFTGLKSFIGL